EPAELLISEGARRPGQPVHDRTQLGRIALGADHHKVLARPLDEALLQCFVSLVEVAQAFAARASTARSSMDRVIGSNGLVITPIAPRVSKRASSCAWALAVMKMTGICASSGRFFSSARTAGPSMPGIITSSRITLGRSPPPRSSRASG